MNHIKLGDAISLWTMYFYVVSDPSNTRMKLFNFALSSVDRKIKETDWPEDIEEAMTSIEDKDYITDSDSVFTDLVRRLHCYVLSDLDELNMLWIYLEKALEQKGLPKRFENYEKYFETF